MNNVERSETKTKSMFARFLSVAARALALMALVLAPAAQAATYTWDGGGADNEWFTDGNWDLAGTPTNTDDVVITSGTVEHNGTAVYNSQHLLITTVDQASSWWPDAPPRGGKSVALSNADVGIQGSLFVGYGSVPGASWTQSSGSLTIGALFLIGGNDYNVGGSDGNGTVYMNGGSIEVTGSIYFADGTQLFEQTDGTVTAASIGVSPPWHQPIFGSYNMNGGTLTLTNTTNLIQEPGGEAGTAWRFKFYAGDIYLGGDQRGIGTNFYFEVLGPTEQYQEIYDPGANVTHLFYAVPPSDTVIYIR